VNSVKATKIWDDDTNRDGKRVNVFLQLYRKIGSNGSKETVGEPVEMATGDSHETKRENTWPNLPEVLTDAEGVERSVVYWIEEVISGTNSDNDFTTGSGAGIKYWKAGAPEGYEVVSTQTKPGEFEVRNIHEPAKKDVSVKVVWNDEDDKDGIRPDHVVVRLKDQDGNETVAKAKITYKDTGDGWIEAVHTFEDLPVYKDGKEIKYTVVELDSDESTERGNGSTAFDDEYAVTITGDGSSDDPFVITNTHTPGERYDVIVTKEWTGDEAHKSTRKDVVLTLLKKVGDNDPTTVKDAEKKTIPADAEGDDLTVRWNDLPSVEKGEDVVYTVREDAIEDYNTHVSDTEIDEDNNEMKITVTNEFKDPEKDKVGDVIYVDPRGDSGKMVVGSTKYWSREEAENAADELRNAPADPDHDGYEFLGWDKNYDDNGNYVMVATYSPIPNKPVVSYVDGQSKNGVIKSEKTDDPSSVKKPKNPKHAGLQFVGWVESKDADGNIIYTAKYKSDCSGKTYTPTVTYIDPATGRVIQKAKKLNPDGTEPKAPKDPKRKGYTFTGWTRTVDKNGNIIYKATWAEYKKGGKWTDVRTGDYANMALWGALIAVAVAALIALIVVKRRKNRKDK
jgi:hypothetical protein